MLAILFCLASIGWSHFADAIICYVGFLFPLWNVRRRRSPTRSSAHRHSRRQRLLTRPKPAGTGPRPAWSRARVMLPPDNAEYLLQFIS